MKRQIIGIRRYLSVFQRSITNPQKINVLKVFRSKIIRIFEIITVDRYSQDTTVPIAQTYTSQIYFDRGYLGSARQTSIENFHREVPPEGEKELIICRNSLMNF
jgi:hypothetical protein